MKQEADNKLSETKILEALSNYGEAYITGSYALDLMVRKEMDVNIALDKPTNETVIEILDDVMRLLSPISLDYRNRTLPETKIRIDGHWIFAKCLDGWKFDIWVIGREEHEKQMKMFDELESRITDANRATIMEIKQQAQQDEEISKTYTGQSVYDAVLDNGITSFAEYKGYLKNSS